LEFATFKHIPGTVVDPKNFNPLNLEPAKLHSDKYGQYFVIPGHSYGLGVAIEKLNVPRDITVICLGKSTYARVGIIANVTPAEAQWIGNLTLEFSNSSPADCRIYANEGVVQLLFLQGEPCQVSYADRNGKYQNQTEKVTLSKV
jgi:dCTP deaminase